LKAPPDTEVEVRVNQKKGFGGSGRDGGKGTEDFEEIESMAPDPRLLKLIPNCYNICFIKATKKEELRSKGE
jgi:hypothetical protein